MPKIVMAALTACLTLLTGAASGQASTSPREIFRATHQAVVVLRMTNIFGKTFRGTGFFVAPNIVATNHHVIKEARSLGIELADGSQFTFREVLAEDPVADTALIEVVERSPHVIRLDPVRRVEIGEPVYVIGNPRGYERTLSQGLVSGIRMRGDAEMLQISASVSQGSSGSPVLNAWGEAIGIVFGRLPEDAQIAFATPAGNLVALRDGGWRPDAAQDVPRSSRTLPAEIQPASLPPRQSGGPMTIRIGVPPWDSAVAVASLLKQAIERFFPVSVDIMPAANEEIFEGIGRSDRTFDIHPDVWLPNHRRFVTEGVHLSGVNYIADQGLCVPRYVLARFSISSRADLTNPTVARLFDLDRDGRGVIWIGEEGWESTAIERLKARDYGYARYFNLKTAPERDIYQTLDRLAVEQRPIAFYCYGPHWVLRKHDLVMLRERPYSPECFKLADREHGTAWHRHSHASCDGPPTRVHRAFAGWIVKELPELVAFLDNVSFDYEELVQVIYDMVAVDRNKAEIARQWVERNAPALRKAAEAARN